MIEQVELRNFGPLKNVSWRDLGAINLVVGGNGCGKTFLLKALYSAIRTIEDHGRGDSPKALDEILLERLHWTFQAERVGDLVSKGADGSLHFRMRSDGAEFAYGFGRDTQRDIRNVKSELPRRSDNSVFLPAKEVLSLHSLILESREREQRFGFDDTYYELARALRHSLRAGRNFQQFEDARTRLQSLLGGKVEYDDVSNRWSFKNSASQRFVMGVTAEGVKKIAIFDTLLGNRYLSPGSVVFMDEPESALHPRALVELLDIVALLASRGIQFFLASHSYFVVKKLHLLAQTSGMSIPMLSIEDASVAAADLKDGIPENAIVRQSIELYRQEADLALSH